MSVSSRRITGATMLIGLLGAGLVTLALVEASAAPSSARRAGSGAEPAGLPAAARPDAVGIAGTAGTTGIAASSRAALRLLSQAAAAGLATSYQGVQIVAWLGPHGNSTSVVHVWHERNRGILAQVTGMGSAPAAPSAQTSPGEQDPDGILGLSRQLVDLMRANYQVTSAGRGSADGRPAQLVDLRRPDGSLAARFWLDAETKLPLRRETFDTSARMISEDALLSVVSIFLQRGQLPAAMPGWREIALRGHAVYSTHPDLRSLAWSAHGFVYTLIAEAPPATVDQVVDALPHDAGPGFWGRIARGLRRLASLANPFR